MKSIFRKIRGKRKDDGERNASKLKNAREYPQPASAPQPAPQSIPRSRSFESLPSQNQNQNVSQRLAPSGPNALLATASSILDEIGSGRLRGKLASSSTESVRNLVQIQPPPLCTVCCNFDPYEASPDDSSYSISWARARYDIPDETPVGKITIEESEQLLEAAKRGCLYCVMVAKALEAVHPGWETNQTFIHIILAVGQPVVVRLEFGATFTVALGREDTMLRFSVVPPEGQGMNLSVNITDTSKLPIEIEIYRPIIPDSRLTASDVTLAPLVQNVTFAEEIPGHTEDQRCIDFIKENVRTCIKQHKCGKDGALPLLPDRVIWIAASNASRIQLLEPKNIRAPFITLSYCWGPIGPNTYLTNRDTINARKAGIEFTDLPPLFQDVINIACALGIEYIWIDRLCIIQGDDKDFHSQAPKMGDIYGNATVTIAAAAATTENDRILVPRDEKLLPLDLDLDVIGIRLKLRIRLLSHALDNGVSGGDFGKISTRAWTWQERLLAARTVFFTSTALKFECRCHSLWQGFDKGRTGRSWSAQLDNITPFFWTSLVEEYMSRDITRPSDRLPAIDAVMKRIEKSTGWSPFWGLWANTLVENLSWSTDNRDKARKHECRMNPDHYAPTWSWASVDGPISYRFTKPLADFEENDPMQWDLECRSLNGASGLIRVAGHIIFLELHATVERKEPHENNSIKKEKFQYGYEVEGSNDAKRVEISSDVPLKAWSGNINGRYLSTVIRVPYGETPPDQTWASHCACILVGNRKMSSAVLVLGCSLRVPGAWERIGFANISPSAFSTSQRQIIDII